MTRTTDPRRPVDELGKLANRLRVLQDQVDRLTAPSGTSAYQSVTKLQALINDIQAQLDDYIANGTYNKIAIDARIAQPPYSVFVSGDLGATGGGSVGGTLSAGGRATLNGGITSTDVHARIVVNNRKAVWIDGAGVMGVSG